MQITRENIDELNAVLRLSISKEDYEPKVEKVLKDYRRTAKIDGFRVGMAPMGLLRKMHGKPVLLEEINKIISDSVSNYMEENKLNILGDPLPNEAEQKSIDWDNPQDMEFVFDIGFAPEFEIKLSKKDKLNQYNIVVDDKMLETYIDNYAQRYGSFKPTKKIEKDELLKGDLAQLDDKGEIIKNGLTILDVTMSLDVMKDEESKKAFKGKKVNDSVDFNPTKAYPNDTDRAAMLRISKEEVNDVTTDFRFTIKEVMKFEKAELNQDLFDKVFEKDSVKTAEEFKAKVKEDIQNNLAFETDYKLKIDSREKLLSKIEMQLPEAFLKRWLEASNKELTPDQIEKDYPLFEQDLKWQLIKDKLLRENEVKIEEQEIIDMAKEVARMQFKQYGINFVEDEHLNTYAQQMIQKEDERKRLVERIIEDKIVEIIKEKVKIEESEVTAEEFNKFFENK